MASTGNLLFTDEEKLLELLEKSELNDYVQTYIWEGSTAHHLLCDGRGLLQLVEEFAVYRAILTND